MLTERVDAKTFSQMFRPGDPGVHLYNSAPFTELMSHVTSGVYYLLMRDSKVRAGIVIGERDGRFYSPFSAPFGGFCFTKEQSVECIDECVEALKSYRRRIELTLPPHFYFPSMSAKCTSSLLRKGRLEYADINYHYSLERVDDFERYLDRSARQKLHDALKHDFRFEVLDSADPAAVERAYRVIKANRDSHGYPLKMSLEQVIATVPVAKTVFMVLSLDGDIDVAAAQVQIVTPEVAQVVYWGDIPGYSAMRPMNLLPREVFRHFRDKGFKTIDIGPASRDGVPDTGLCVYKENIGCLPSLKPTFSLN